MLAIVSTVLGAAGAYAQFKAPSAPPAPARPAMPAPAVPSLSSPSLAPAPSAPSLQPPAAAAVPSAPPVQVVPNCRRPEDCPDHSAQERARERFAECVEKARTPNNTIDDRKLEDCALGFMSPNRLARFRQCLRENPRETAWACFRQAYVN
jgi:hypothetical protein